LSIDAPLVHAAVPSCADRDTGAGLLDFVFQLLQCGNRFIPPFNREYPVSQQQMTNVRPSSAFVGASWVALFVGAATFLIGLWNAQMQLNEKGYYLTLLLYGSFAAVSLQKTLRDRVEGLPVTGLYFGLCWISLGAAILLLSVGLWNATLLPSEKGFYGISFLLTLFAIIAVQKNVRDTAAAVRAEAA
jgi:uncharacterized membrane protein YiaA